MSQSEKPCFSITGAMIGRWSRGGAKRARQAFRLFLALKLAWNVAGLFGLDLSTVKNPRFRDPPEGAARNPGGLEASTCV